MGIDHIKKETRMKPVSQIKRFFSNPDLDLTFHVILNPNPDSSSGFGSGSRSR